jgi:hypothetical protein
MEYKIHYKGNFLFVFYPLLNTNTATKKIAILESTPSIRAIENDTG